MDAVAFPTLSEAQIEQLGRYAGTPPKKLRAGEALFRTGDRDFKFFVVKAGEVEILDETGDKPKTVTVRSGAVAILSQKGSRTRLGPRLLRCFLKE